MGDRVLVLGPKQHDAASPIDLEELLIFATLIKVARGNPEYERRCLTFQILEQRGAFRQMFLGKPVRKPQFHDGGKSGEVSSTLLPAHCSFFAVVFG